MKLYCSQCGKKLSEDDFFCSKCGHRVQRNDIWSGNDEGTFDETKFFNPQELFDCLENEHQEIGNEKEIDKESISQQRQKEREQSARAAKRLSQRRQQNLKAEAEADEESDDDITETASETAISSFKNIWYQLKNNRKSKVRIEAATDDFHSVLQESSPEFDRLETTSNEVIEEEQSFKGLFLGVILLGLVIGVILGLILINPFAEEEDSPETPIMVVAPVDIFEL